MLAHQPPSVHLCAESDAMRSVWLCWRHSLGLVGFPSSLWCGPPGHRDTHSGKEQPVSHGWTLRLSETGLPWTALLSTSFLDHVCMWVYVCVSVWERTWCVRLFTDPERFPSCRISVSITEMAGSVRLCCNRYSHSSAHLGCFPPFLLFYNKWPWKSSAIHFFFPLWSYFLMRVS